MSPSAEGNKEWILVVGAAPAGLTAAYRLNSEYHGEPEVLSRAST